MDVQSGGGSFITAQTTGTLQSEWWHVSLYCRCDVEGVEVL